MCYRGIIIEESLKDSRVMKGIKILKTEVGRVTEEHQTPWLKQWTLYTVEIPEEKVEIVAKEISKNLETEHTAWYADFKSDLYHYIVFSNKIFKVKRSKLEEYEKVKEYGIKLGIPDYQLDFSPNIK